MFNNLLSSVRIKCDLLFHHPLLINTGFYEKVRDVLLNEKNAEILTFSFSYEQPHSSTGIWSMRFKTNIYLVL